MLSLLKYRDLAIKSLFVLGTSFTTNAFSDSAVGTFLDDTRLHVHTRLPNPQVNDIDFYRVRQRMEGLGVKTYTRHVKTGSEDPWWELDRFDKNPPPGSTPSGGTYSATQTTAIVRSFFDGSDGRDQNVIGYYWLGTQDSQLVASAHPEWGARNLNGSPASHDQKGNEIDITYSGYQDYVVAELKQLAGFGAKGVYFDNRHGNGEGVFGTALENRYVARYGAAALPSQQNLDTDPNYVRYLEFNALELAAAIKSIRNRVTSTSATANFKFIVSCTTLPSLMHPLMHSRLAATADVPKIEYRLPVAPSFQPTQVLNDMQIKPYASISTRLSYGMNLLRTASDSMPHIWGHDFVDVNHYRGFIVSSICFGGIANLDLEDSFVLTPASANPKSRSLTHSEVASLITLGNNLSRGVKNLSPMKYAAFYHSEALRAHYRGAHSTAWRTAIAPPLMAYESLSKWGVPCSVVTDDIVAAGGLSQYACLFVADRANLPAAHKNRINDFANAGGKVYDVTISVPNRELSADSAQDIITAKNAAPVYRMDPSAPLGSVFTNSAQSRITVAITNPVSWIQENRESSSNQPQFLSYNSWGYALEPASTPNAPPKSFSGMKVFVKTNKKAKSATNHFTNSPVNFSEVNGGILLTVPGFVYGAIIEIVF
jgi:hypothetical protein